MCTKIIDYTIDFIFFYTRYYYYYYNIVDLMHVQILNEHLCSWTITWLNKLSLLLSSFVLFFLGVDNAPGSLRPWLPSRLFFIFLGEGDGLCNFLIISSSIWTQK